MVIDINIIIILVVVIIIVIVIVIIISILTITICITFLGGGTLAIQNPQGSSSQVTIKGFTGCEGKVCFKRSKALVLLLSYMTI